MYLWIVFAAMTGVAILAIVVPLSRKRREAGSEAQDLAVYRDQLAAVDEDVARGVLPDSEAAAARTEISRRMLAAERDPEAGGASAAAISGPRASVALGLGLLVVIVALGGYLTFGSPDLPGQPLAERQSKPLAEQDIQMLIVRIEGHLRDKPEDGKGWDLIAPIYLRLGRFEDASRAYSNAIRLVGENAQRLSGLGEAITQANGGTVTAEARDAFDRAAAIDPSLPRPRFYIAVSMEQDGDLEGAYRAWRALLADLPDQAPWRRFVEARVAALEAEFGDRTPARENSGVEAPARPTPDAIRGMVEGLAERLKSDGSDLDGWLMLMRSYVTLGRLDDARSAMAEALANFPDDEQARTRIAAAARELNIAAGDAPQGGRN